MNNNLTKELIKRIVGNLGIVIGNDFGKVGITTKEFVQTQLKTNNELGIEELTNFYCGKIELKETQDLLRIAFIELSEDEFIISIRMNELPIYIIYIDYIYNTELTNFFLINNTKKESVGIINQLQITIGIEQITQDGILWEPCNNYADLKDAILSSVSS